MTIWDQFCDTPGKIRDGAHVNRTCNHLAMYKEDIAMMRALGANSYRFSIAWPRVIPLGGKEDPVNEKGVKFYNDVIDECLKHGLTPFVTLYHWDLPLELFNRYGGWLAKDSIVPDFTSYAKLCFERFGDRVKHWLTLNEPWCTAVLGHGIGQFAPGHVSNTEPWIVGHSLMIAHASAAKLYINEFKRVQGGSIGITLNGDWTEPFDESPETQNGLCSRMVCGSDLSREFYGCNTYTTNTIKAVRTDDEFAGYTTMAFDTPDGGLIGKRSQLGWLRDVPWGFRKILNYLYQRYQKPIYMTENDRYPSRRHDKGRVEYYAGYTQALKEAVEIDGVDVRSYFGWSFLDNFEWASGLGPRFGSVYVDYETFERTPKDSARSLMQVSLWASAPADDPPVFPR
ncbi:uncharacterized protein IL334_006903 [Kwoniella shivajii]|uniref:Beta-glucosidase n=1 Tax=Kwoniella shivajii TaxID=564305 RepID=A0ABZ1DB80_9TREE|nr:hypothetical protein IL334_006903 [Kwoniella shivajii]